MFNNKFRQTLSIIIESQSHESCLWASKIIKKQCEAWFFNVTFEEHKSARKGDVLKREILIYQVAYSGDILIFKEAIRRICQYFEQYNVKVDFIDRGSIPEQ